MFDIGWSEMAVVALIALIVIGPKELPKAMRSLAKWTRKARSMAREPSMTSRSNTPSGSSTSIAVGRFCSRTDWETRCANEGKAAYCS